MRLLQKKYKQNLFLCKNATTIRFFQAVDMSICSPHSPKPLIITEILPGNVSLVFLQDSYRSLMT